MEGETGPRQMPSRYLRRRLELLISLYPQLQSAPQIPAGHLARTGFHIDVAASAVQVQRQRVLKRLAGILPEQLRLFPDVALPPQQRLLEGPALFIHLAANLRAQLFANPPEN